MTALRRRLRALPNAFAVACLLSVAAGWGFVRYGDESQWPASLLMVAPQWLWLVPPIAALVVGYFGKLRWVPAFGAVMLCAAAILPGGFELATGSPGAVGEPVGPRVRIVTWNVHNETQHADEIRRKLLALKPDVVCLQEALDHDAFENLLPGWHQSKVYAVRTFSRWPILDNVWFGLREGDYRQWPASEIRTPGGPLVVFNVHFVQNVGGDSLERHTGDLAQRLERYAQQGTNQVDVVLAALPPARPVVVAGDFNTPPRSQHYRALARRMTDAFAASEFGFGYTYLIGKRIPSWRIDYVWCANGVRPVHTRVQPAWPSDHRPVVVDVAMPAR